MDSKKLPGIKLLAETKNLKSVDRYIPYILGFILLIALFITSRYNFLIFHILAEFFAIAVAWSVFIKELLKNKFPILNFKGAGEPDWVNWSWDRV